MDFKPIFHVCGILLAVLNIIVNTFVIIILIKCNKLLKRPAIHILLSLATNDCLSGVLLILHNFSYFYLHVNGKGIYRSSDSIIFCCGEFDYATAINIISILLNFAINRKVHHVILRNALFRNYHDKTSFIIYTFFMDDSINSYFI